MSRFLTCGFAILLAAQILLGCESPRSMKAVPSPVLLPDSGKVEGKMAEEASSRIASVEQRTNLVDPKKLSKEQQETYLTIQSFLVKAKKAMLAKDFSRASTLADKASILAEELRVK
jgi:hypothetical protein